MYFNAGYNLPLTSSNYYNSSILGFSTGFSTIVVFKSVFGSFIQNALCWLGISFTIFFFFI
jgi:hypothetical protein